MSNQNLTNAAIDNLVTFLTKLIPDIALNAAGVGKIADINKAAGNLSLELYGVYSNNIPDATMNTVKRILECKYAGVLDELVAQIAACAQSQGTSPLAAIQAQLSNKGYSVKMTKSQLADKINMNESGKALAESLLSRVQFASSTLGTAVLNEKGDNGISNVAGQGTKVPMGVDWNRSTVSKKGKIKTESDSVPVDFVVRVALMNVESEKVLESIASSKNRDHLFNYIKLRAGATSFFKDFLLNLDEIDKEVKRDTSSSLTDRLMSDMSRQGGFLSPKAFSKIAEAKYYILCLEQTDVDMLKSHYKFDVNKPHALEMLFKQFNILSLVIVDTLKKNVRMYDSDNPLKSQIYNYDQHDSAEDIASMFSALARK